MLSEFMAERESHVFERRGFQVDEVRAVVPQWWSSPGGAFRRLEALAQARKSAEFEALAALFKRVKNITRDFDGTLDAEARSKLVLPAEKALLQELDARWPAIRGAVAEERFEKAVHELGAFSGPVDRFFVDVLVMSEDQALRKARLALLTALRSTILTIADISEIAPTTES